MRPDSYRTQQLPCCSNCCHCEYVNNYDDYLCLNQDDQDNLDDSVTYELKDRIDFYEARIVHPTSICDKFENRLQSNDTCS